MELKSGNGIGIDNCIKLLIAPLMELKFKFDGTVEQFEKIF